MFKGKTIKVEWGEYAMPHFKLNLKDRGRWNSCGSAALSMITGEDAGDIERQLPKSAEHWTTHSALKFLRKRGWKIIPVTVNSVTNVGWTLKPLNADHLLLIGAHMDAHDASWLVAHRETIYHNFEEESTSPLYFINKPTIEVWLLHKEMKAPPLQMRRGDDPPWGNG